MSEAGDYTPSSHYDFKEARAHYDRSAGRSYSNARAAGKKTRDCIAESIKTLCERPLIIVSDQTGSMGKWPAVIFSKLPYMYHEVKTEYLGKDAEIAFLAIGDANNPDKENYPLQVRPFTKGVDELKAEMDKLIIEKQGGGTMQETYELAGLYLLHKCSMPHAINPIVIFIGDEQAYESVSKAAAKEFVDVDLPGAIKTKQIFTDLRQKCAVYFIQKPYGDSGRIEPLDGTSASVYAHWAKLIGEEYICLLPDAERVVDVIFGILAKETGKLAYFVEEIEARQRKEQVDTVYKSLATVHTGLNDESDKLIALGHSTMHKPLGGTRGRKLLP